MVSVFNLLLGIHISQNYQSMRDCTLKKEDEVPQHRQKENPCFVELALLLYMLHIFHNEDLGRAKELLFVFSLYSNTKLELRK